MSDLIWREENSFLCRSFTRHTVDRALHDLAIAPKLQAFLGEVDVASNEFRRRAWVIR
ncbi:MAG: hypothetical protein J0H42_11430 [Rhizobiales bacterium]|nr:hypothetical protein [Hyphomicrobiales bacterium]